MIDEEAFEARARMLVAKKILRNMLILQAAHKQNLRIANPPPKHSNPAKPGQYPHGRTWNARDGVVTEPRNLGTIAQTLTGRTGILINAAYMAILKNKGWKGIEDTHAELKAAGAYK